MKENIVPSYLPAVSVQMTPKAGGESVTVFRPYEAYPVSELEKHAAENECGALLSLGERYFYGILGVQQDYQKAFDYLKAAAELGAQDAQALLAEYYLSDEISLLETDPEKGEEMLLMAAENGSWHAMEKLSQAYSSGFAGVRIDHEKAYAWAEQSERMTRIYWEFYAQPNFVDFTVKQKDILHGNTRAALALYYACMNGVGVKRDLNAAKKWLDRGEQFVCRITGLAKVPVFQEKRAELNARVQKDEARAEKKRRADEKKK